MYEALETMTEHARVLEHTATEHHRRRHKQSKEAMTMVLEDDASIERFHKSREATSAT